MTRTIEHTEEFPLEQAEHPKLSQRELAGAYSRTFGTPDGKRVLADLMVKFDPEMPRFHNHSDHIRAAIIDGRSDVMREIRQAIAAGKPITGIPD